MRDKFNYNDILKDDAFLSRIRKSGNVDLFRVFWNEGIYHKVEYHTKKQVELLISRFEKKMCRQERLRILQSLNVEFPELYNPNNSTLLVLLPDASGDAAIRLSEFNYELKCPTRHHIFNSREKALEFAADSGCIQHREGMLDEIASTPEFEKWIYKAACSQNNRLWYVQILKEKDPYLRSLFSEEIADIKSQRKIRRRNETEMLNR